MDFLHSLGDCIEALGIFGGIAMVILASSKARVEKMRAERTLWQQPVVPQSDTMLDEIRSLKQQVAEMQSTGHQFDISFDAALSRLEGRVDRIETKVATVGTAAPPATEATLRNGAGPSP